MSNSENKYMAWVCRDEHTKEVVMHLGVNCEDGNAIAPADPSKIVFNRNNARVRGEKRGEPWLLVGRSYEAIQLLTALRDAIDLYLGDKPTIELKAEEAVPLAVHEAVKNHLKDLQEILHLMGTTKIIIPGVPE